MIKLAFEYMLRDLGLNQNFELIYEYIKTFGEHLESINFRIIDKTSLKSNHYWLMAIIPKLTKLKQFTIIAENDQPATQDMFKFLSKAFSYYQKNGGKLTKYTHRIRQPLNSALLYQVLKCIPDLQVLCFRGTYLGIQDCKDIGKVLSDFKFISELDLTDTSISKVHGKEIADGLIRAK